MRGAAATLQAVRATVAEGQPSPILKKVVGIIVVGTLIEAAVLMTATESVLDWLPDLYLPSVLPLMRLPYFNDLTYETLFGVYQATAEFLLRYFQLGLIAVLVGWSLTSAVRLAWEKANLVPSGKAPSLPIATIRSYIHILVFIAWWPFHVVLQPFGV